MIKHKIYFTGDIHGEFMPLVFVLTKRYNLSDCSVIVCGDIGMGFYKFNYYIDTFKTMNKKLAKKNIQLYLIRGNHDNPDYFNCTPEELTSFSHVHLVRDYTVLHIGNHHILCVGGATSVDKKFRTKDIDWWEFENVLPYEKLNYENIDIVATHCAPMFCPPSYQRISWMDDELDKKSQGDRTQLAEMYFDLIKNNELKYWFYGHYHNHYRSLLPTGYFTEIDKHYLMNGQTLDEDYKSNDDELCKFIGLDMLNKNNVDLYEII